MKEVGEWFMGYSSDDLEPMENAQIWRFLISFISGIIVVGMGISVYEDYKSGRDDAFNMEVLKVTAIVFIISIVVNLIISHYLKKKQGEQYASLRFALSIWFPFLEPKNERLEYCKDEMVKNSTLWKQFGKRFRWRTFVWSMMSFALALFCFWDAWKYYNNPYELEDYISRRARVFYSVDNPLTVVYLRVVFGVVLLIIALAIFFSVKEYCFDFNLKEYAEKYGIKYKKLNKEFEKSVYCGNAMWIGKNYFFFWTDEKPVILPVTEIAEMDIMWMEHAGEVSGVSALQKELRIKTYTLGEFSVFAYWAASFYKVKKRWEQYCSK